MMPHTQRVHMHTRTEEGDAEIGAEGADEDYAATGAGELEDKTR